MDKSKFLGSGGIRLVRQLFIESDYVQPDKNLAVYSLSRKDKEVDGVVYPSLYRLYMEEGDITEARFVEKYLYDVDHWEKIAACAILKDEVAKWRKELKHRVLGELVDTLMEDAKSDSRSSKSSAKYLVDKFSKETKGRPGRKGQSESLSPTRLFEEDLERIKPSSSPVN